MTWSPDSSLLAVYYADDDGPLYQTCVWLVANQAIVPLFKLSTGQHVQEGMAFLPGQASILVVIAAGPDGCRCCSAGSQQLSSFSTYKQQPSWLSADDLANQWHDCLLLWRGSASMSARTVAVIALLTNHCCLTDARPCASFVLVP